MSGVTVTVRLFAMLRERAGRDAFELQLADGATVADALEALRDRDGLGDMLDRLPVLAAVNREYAASETPLAPGDELALIPPVSGGGETGPRARIRSPMCGSAQSRCRSTPSPAPWAGPMAGPW
jgi:MoaE-MoaD fusion protein